VVSKLFTDSMPVATLAGLMTRCAIRSTKLYAVAPDDRTAQPSVQIGTMAKQLKRLPARHVQAEAVPAFGDLVAAEFGSGKVQENR